MSEQSSKVNETSNEKSAKPNLTRGRSNPYAEKMKNGSNLVLIEPDVFEVFQDSEAVNDALRLLIETAATLNKKIPKAS